MGVFGHDGVSVNDKGKWINGVFIVRYCVLY